MDKAISRNQGSRKTLRTEQGVHSEQEDVIEQKADQMREKIKNSPDNYGSLRHQQGAPDNYDYLRHQQGERKDGPITPPEKGTARTDVIGEPDYQDPSPPTTEAERLSS